MRGEETERVVGGWPAASSSSGPEAKGLEFRRAFTIIVRRDLEVELGRAWSREDCASSHLRSQSRGRVDAGIPEGACIIISDYRG